jgi:hypothetical protein
MEIIRLARQLGAVAGGVATVENLIGRKAIDLDILPSARSIVVIACGRVVLEFGLRGMTKFMGGMLNASSEQQTEMLKSHFFRELWQTLVSGNYYYCFECQALCPIGKGNR